MKKTTYGITVPYTGNPQSGAYSTEGQIATKQMDALTVSPDDLKKESYNWVRQNLSGVDVSIGRNEVWIATFNFVAPSNKIGMNAYWKTRKGSANITDARNFSAFILEGANRVIKVDTTQPAAHFEVVAGQTYRATIEFAAWTSPTNTKKGNFPVIEMYPYVYEK